MEEISVLSAGERFSFKGFDWITLGHTEDGGVLAIMDGCWKEMPFDNKRDYTNNYAKSTLRKTLREELLPILGEENMLPHVVDLVADNGDDSYGMVTDKVFILSCDEYRKYRKHIPLLEEWSWMCTPGGLTRPMAAASTSVPSILRVDCTTAVPTTVAGLPRLVYSILRILNCAAKRKWWRNNEFLY